MKPSRKEIIEVLHSIEQKRRLKEGTLVMIYDEEARVVFKGRRRDVYTNLRQILADATEEKGVSNDNLKN